MLMAYLAMPIDLVPDFLPVLGHADDAIVVAVVLRSVVRRAGAAAVERHWPGTPERLAELRRASRLPPISRNSSGWRASTCCASRRSLATRPER